MKMP